MEQYTEDTEAVGIVPIENESEQDQLLVKTTLQLTDDLVRSYLERQRLWGADTKQLYASLKPDAGESRLEAIQIIGKRQLRDAVPTLLVLLEDEDERIRDAALGALLRMQETRAVTVLTRSRAMRDSREMHKVIEAVASLGGPEALSYLAFVAENHDSESIRIAANKAIKRIRKIP
jgi:HEAT repeat protein